MNLFNTFPDGVLKFFRVKSSDWWVKSSDWWIKITTIEPRCIYYFGPFETFLEAKATHFGYLEDLQNEKAQGFSVDIGRCQPTELTIFDDNS